MNNQAKNKTRMLNHPSKALGAQQLAQQQQMVNVNRLSTSTIESNYYSNGRAGNNLVHQQRASTSLDG